MTTKQSDMLFYKSIVDFCSSNDISDYEVKKPLICHMNRDNFLLLLQQYKVQDNDSSKVHDNVVSENS